MILTYTVTGATINTNIHTPLNGFDYTGNALDETGAHTIVFKSQVSGIPDQVWNWSTEAFKNDALANINDAIAGALLVAEVDAEGIVTEVSGS